MGKTTTVRSIMGLTPATAGTIRFGGAEVARLPPYRIAKLGIGLVPEGRQIFSNLTTRENLVATSANRRAVPAPWTLDKVCALFPRLAEREGQMANLLSGGEQQMLAIGRALMTNPRLLILDEATEGLAPLIRDEIWRCLEQLRAAGQSILVIDKDVEALTRIADRHYIIERGRVVWSGKFARTCRDARAATPLSGRLTHSSNLTWRGLPPTASPVAPRPDLVQKNHPQRRGEDRSSAIPMPKAKKRMGSPAAAVRAVILGGMLGGIAAALTANAAHAQQPAAPRPAPAPRPAQPAAPQQTQSQPPSDAPQSTTASYGDWVVQCQTQAGAQPQKFCDMAQVSQAQVQGRAIPFSRVALTRPARGEPVRFIVQVPVNVSFATNVHIQSGEADPGITSPFARCLPAGCFAEIELKDDVLRKFRAAAAGGKLTFADAGGHDISVPLSFNGFAQAFDALMKE